jgi:hypothetical protein
LAQEPRGLGREQKWQQCQYDAPGRSAHCWRTPGSTAVLGCQDVWCSRPPEHA